MKTSFAILLIASSLLLSCHRQSLSEDETQEEESATGHVVLKINNTTVFDEEWSEQIYWSQTENAVLFQYKENDSLKLGGAVEHIPPVSGSFPIVPYEPQDNESTVALTSNTGDIHTPDRMPIWMLLAQSGTVSHPSERDFHIEGRCIIYANPIDYEEYDFELDITVARIY